MPRGQNQGVKFHLYVTGVLFEAPVFYFYFMIVRSTNIGERQNVVWRGKTIRTGIFKYPVDGPVFLNIDSVDKDVIADRKVHGGTYKACYLFSTDPYPYWQGLYPNLEWNWGMFGENLTVEGMDENDLFLGDIYRLGNALVQVSQPREPCYKLGIRFGSQAILAQFIEHSCPGTYVRVLEKGSVKNGDALMLESREEKSISVREFFQLIFSRQKDPELIERVLHLEALPLAKREKLKRYIK